MRLKKWAKPELADCPYFTEEPQRYYGRWSEMFPREAPLHVELGCGKGVGTAKMTSDNRDVNYVVSDIASNVLGYTRRNLEDAYGKAKVDNVIIARFDITRIDSVFSAEDRIGRIHINFCNPWTQNVKQAKKRLTHPRQLLKYREFLSENGEIYFKTDDAELFSDSTVYFRYCGFDTVYRTDDLHSSGFSPNYVSEHEEKYVKQGIPIHFGIYRKADRKIDIDPLKWDRFGPPYTTGEWRTFRERDEKPVSD